MPLHLLRRVPSARVTLDGRSGSVPRLLLTVLAGAIVVALPSVARANATIGVFQEQSLPRIDRDGKDVRKRPIALKPEGVNYQDCVDDQKIRFPLNLSGFEGNASLQAWAGLGGADCKQQQNRSGINATCWPLVTGIPLQTNPVVEIPVRLIMAGAPPFRPADIAQGETMCGNVDLATISVQFLYFSPGQLATPTAGKEIGVEVDTIGPLPPTGLRTLPGNQRITVKWDNISGEGGLSVLTGVKVYCDPAGAGSASTTDSGATTSPEASCTEVPNDGGEDAGTTTVCEDAGSSTSSSSGGTTSAACASPNLASTPDAPVIPDAEFNAKFECGSITGNSGSTVAATEIAGVPLSNGTSYAVAVAATDAFNNVGPLSSLICELPEVTTDFWENYKNAGGGAGGGLCTSSSPGTPVGSLSALALIAVAAIGSLRRNRSRR